MSDSYVAIYLHGSKDARCPFILVEAWFTKSGTALYFSRPSHTPGSGGHCQYYHHYLDYHIYNHYFDYQNLITSITYINRIII